MQKIGKNIYVETGIRGCCNHGFLVDKKGIVMIDTPVLPNIAVKWNAEIEKHGSVKYLINTEYHADHFGGNCFFDGIVIAHEGTKKGIMDASTEQVRQMLLSIKTGVESEGVRLPDDFYIRIPTITFTQELILYMENYTIHLIQMPGHTQFETVVYIPEEKILFASDNVVTKTIPFFGHSTPYEWLESLELMEEMDFDILVPGHGNISEKSCISDMRKSIMACMDAVKRAIDKGMTLEEAQDRVRLNIFFPDLREDKKTLMWLQRTNISHLYKTLIS